MALLPSITLISAGKLSALQIRSLFSVLNHSQSDSIQGLSRAMFGNDSKTFPNIIFALYVFRCFADITSVDREHAIAKVNLSFAAVCVTQL